jgi:NADH dehydrogenase
MDKLVTVFGGTGFLGRHVVRALVKRDFRVRVAVRRPALAGHLQPLGRVGQIHAVQANLRYPASVDAAVRDADCVVNLVGVLFESGRQTFANVHSAGAETVALAAASYGLPLVHGSALGADENSLSAYARSKAEGERLVRAAVGKAIIMRPSIIFGTDDSFFNRFAAMARFSPFLPLIGGGATRFQPVFAGDVATAFADAVDGKATPGTTYELGGPDIRTFRQLMEFVLKVTGRRRVLLPLPFGLAKLQASVLQFMPKPLLTPDQVELLKTDNVVSQAAIETQRTLAGLGIAAPVSFEDNVPTYLWRYRKFGQFSSGSAPGAPGAPGSENGGHSVA